MKIKRGAENEEKERRRNAKEGGVEKGKGLKKGECS
jgi:hypothetical protein